MKIFLYQHNLENIVKEGTGFEIIQNLALLIYFQPITVLISRTDFLKLVTAMIKSVFQKINLYK